MSNNDLDQFHGPDIATQPIVRTRGYQQELLEESLRRNIIIALDTGSGKTHISVLRMKHEAEHESRKVSWFIAPTVALVAQQCEVIKSAIPVSVGLVSGSSEPDQWKDASLWRRILSSHRIMVTTPQVLLDALHHGYVDMGSDIGLLVFDEAHHAVGRHPYNMIMKNHYFHLPPRDGMNNTTSRVRPMILGLTASPTYGGNVHIAFRDLENNLDCTIRSSRNNRDELAQHVHRPVFKHILFAAPTHTYDAIPSVNYQALSAVVATLNIEEDPYVISLRARLDKLQPGEDRRRVDQKLSKAIDKQDTFTHKGLRDFVRTAADICIDLGTWAADWYVAKVIERAKLAANPYNNIMSAWQEKEKRYLLEKISQVQLTQPSTDPQDIIDAITPKVRMLVESLADEEAIFRSMDEDYSGLIFVTRRDTVIVLAELLRRIPKTAQLFRVGCLLGSSSSFKRHAFLDITRSMLDETQADTLRDFKIGDKNLIVSTSVAEEGIDIQACGSVVRFDIPPNVVSFAQSRGRARRKRSSFVLMFEETVPQELVRRWEETEQQMMAAYNDPKRDAVVAAAVPEKDDFLDGTLDREFKVASTGALLTIHSAIPHLNHFCGVIPSGGHDSHLPVYELDPPDYAESWHSLGGCAQSTYPGPWGATVTLPRALPLHLRKFTTLCIHPTKRRAEQDVAFNAYMSLYHAGLLNDHLLPLSSAIEPDKKEEVEGMLAEVAKRASTARVSVQMDPWVTCVEENTWFAHELVVQGMPSLRMFTRNPLPPLTQEELPTLYVPKLGKVTVNISAVTVTRASGEEVLRAREWTYNLFYRIYGARMERDQNDFSYLFLPAGEWSDAARWEERRRWHADRVSHGATVYGENAAAANAAVFGRHFSYPNDVALVRRTAKNDKVLQLVDWRYEPMSAEEEEAFRAQYEGMPDLEVTYPLIVAKSLHKRRNFLVSLPSEGAEQETAEIRNEDLMILHPKYALVELVSQKEVDYTLWLPSILRWLSMALTVHSLRTRLFANFPVSEVPFPLLITAITAPAAQEPINYQRLETLGDTVLKFIVSNQLYAEYPLWHEGYLSRKKDHAVANVNLAKDAVKKGLYQWIIRDRFVPRKWKPHYTSALLNNPDKLVEDEAASKDSGDDKGNAKKNKGEDLSTKMLADVVESLIGAAYKHGGFDLAIECAQRFGLGLSWKKLPERLAAMHEVEDLVDLPDQLSLVEQMINYRFTRRTFLVQALTHASYQGDSATMSLERLEFLGDSALDMIVVDYLYHASGKNYSPGYMHIKKEAVVNSHILAYTCLNASVAVESAMPAWSPAGGLSMVDNTQRVHLWQCLLHSSHRVLEDQNLTFLRYQKHGGEIARALEEDAIYPWASLTSLQAPKFISDIVESLLGAVYIDSFGDLDAVRIVMRSLGLMRILERVVLDDVDVLHPVSRLEIWAAKQKPAKKVEYVLERGEGDISCAVLIDEKELVRETASYRSKVSEDEVRFRAAEQANTLVNAQSVDVDEEDSDFEEMEVIDEDGDQDARAD